MHIVLNFSLTLGLSGSENKNTTKRKQNVLHNTKANAVGYEPFHFLNNTGPYSVERTLSTMLNMKCNQNM